jgi:hypothetical protein
MHTGPFEKISYQNQHKTPGQNTLVFGRGRHTTQRGLFISPQSAVHRRKAHVTPPPPRPTLPPETLEFLSALCELTRIPASHTYVHPYTHTHIYMHICARTHTHMGTHIRIYKHTFQQQMAQGGRNCVCCHDRAQRKHQVRCKREIEEREWGRERERDGERGRERAHYTKRKHQV